MKKTKEFNSTKNYSVYSPIESPLSELPGHRDMVGVYRELLLGSEHTKSSPAKIAIHHVDVQDSSSNDSMMDSESHDFDEINIILATSEKPLIYQYEIDGESFKCEAPNTIHICPNAKHKMYPISGKGIFICIRLNHD